MGKLGKNILRKAASQSSSLVLYEISLALDGGPGPTNRNLRTRLGTIVRERPFIAGEE
jgi:hypothetical protein